ncbi:nucleoside-diphosphate kinase [Streptomyces sp. NPDC059552]|uniref:nucleoside-diphosphate kinase n=1 Tax=Streptomyces sp. NPDC059552 TaxID=3346862 RepID=UPI0036BDD3BD
MVSPREWWRPLTVVDAKAEEFARETYFREASADLHRAAGGLVAATLQRLAVITFKPEAIVGRRIPTALDFMERNGFRPIAFRRLRLHRHRARELWRFQWNVATLDRLAVADLLMPSCDSLWVAFWDETSPLTVPGTVRFRGLKGPAYPSVRKKGQLRHELGGTNRMMTFIHAADEPLDIIRELGILFDPQERQPLIRDIAAAAGADVTDRLLEQLGALHAEVPQEELDITAVMRRLNDALAELMVRRPSPDLRAVRQILARVHDGGVLEWTSFAHVLEQARVRLPLWDLVQIGAQYIQHDEENTVCTIDDDGRAGWLLGHGTMLPLSTQHVALTER